jgi:TetR/AcrR family transcriptional regulator
MVATLVTYLAHRPGICAGLLGALGATGRMTEVLHANDTWIAGPLRELLTEARTAGVATVPNVTDAANAVLGALLLAVLGRSTAGADPTDPQFRHHLTDQVLHGILTR